MAKLGNMYITSIGTDVRIQKFQKGGVEGAASWERNRVYARLLLPKGYKGCVLDVHCRTLVGGMALNEWYEANADKQL